MVQFVAIVSAPSTTIWATSQGFIMHAKGDFDVTLTPQKADDPPAQGASLTRISIDKRYRGNIEAVGQGEMLASGDGKLYGAYVAIEKISGTLDGRHGSFALVHRAVMNHGVPEDWQILIVPGSGTGQLAGISGTLTITKHDGKHLYELDYTLPGQ